MRGKLSAMGAKKKKQRHIKPKAGAAKTAEEGSGDEGEDAPENAEAVAPGTEHGRVAVTHSCVL